MVPSDRALVTSHTLSNVSICSGLAAIFNGKFKLQVAVSQKQQEVGPRSLSLIGNGICLFKLHKNH